LIGEGDELDVPAGYVFDDDESDGILTEAFKITEEQSANFAVSP